MSSDHRSVLLIDSTGRLVRRTAGASSWSSATRTTAAKARGTRLRIDEHGRLVLQRSSGGVVWHSQRVAAARRMVLTDDGALLLMGANTTKTIVPAATPHTVAPAPSKSASPAPVAPSPSVTSPAQLVVQQELRSGEGLVSDDARFHLQLQHDGNLVLSGPNGTSWSTGVLVGDDATVTMQPDGNVVVHDAAGQPRWATRTEIAGSFLALLDDGDLVVFSPDGRALWSSKSSGRA